MSGNSGNPNARRRLTTPALAAGLIACVLLCGSIVAQVEPFGGARGKISGEIFVHRELKTRPAAITDVEYSARLARFGLDASAPDSEQCALYVERQFGDAAPWRKRWPAGGVRRRDPCLLLPTRFPDQPECFILGRCPERLKRRRIPEPDGGGGERSFSR